MFKPVRFSAHARPAQRVSVPPGPVCENVMIISPPTAFPEEMLAPPPCPTTSPVVVPPTTLIPPLQLPLPPAAAEEDAVVPAAATLSVTTRRTADTIMAASFERQLKVLESRVEALDQSDVRTKVSVNQLMHKLDECVRMLQSELEHVTTWRTHVTQQMDTWQTAWQQSEAKGAELARLLKARVEVEPKQLEGSVVPAPEVHDGRATVAETTDHPQKEDNTRATARKKTPPWSSRTVFCTALSLFAVVVSAPWFMLWVGSPSPAAGGAVEPSPTEFLHDFGTPGVFL